MIRTIKTFISAVLPSPIVKTEVNYENSWQPLVSALGEGNYSGWIYMKTYLLEDGTKVFAYKHFLFSSYLHFSETGLGYIPTCQGLMRDNLRVIKPIAMRAVRDNKAVMNLVG